MRVWERFLSEEDRKLETQRAKRELNGLGNRFGLLVIDMQVATVGYNKPIYEQLDEFFFGCGPYAWKAIPVQQRLLAAARQAGIQVIYSKHSFHPSAGLPRAFGNDGFSSLDRRSEIVSEIAMQEGDLLVEKQRPSCFQFTNLPLILQSLKIDSLLVCGNATSGCIRATCVDAPGFGIRTQVIEEATFDRYEMSHAAALFDMQLKICDVIGVDQALEAIAKVQKRVA